jgi:hypothetical protein
MPSRDQPEFAPVQLDADTIYKFEAFLRDGLVASGAISEADNQPLRRKSLRGRTHVTVSLDPKALARFSELLRQALISGDCIRTARSATLNIMTGKVR